MYIIVDISYSRRTAYSQKEKKYENAYKSGLYSYY